MSDNVYFCRMFVVCLVVSCFLIFSFLFFGVSEGSKVDFVVANQTYSEIEKMRSEASVFSIFLNNFVISVVSLVPVLGVVWMLFIQFNTGYVFGCLSVYYNVNPYILVSSVMTSPVGFLEYLAYTFILGESLMLVVSAFNRQFKERLFKHTPKTLILVAILLFLGAYIEYIIIGLLG